MRVLDSMRVKGATSGMGLISVRVGVLVDLLFATVEGIVKRGIRIFLKYYLDYFDKFTIHMSIHCTYAEFCAPKSSEYINMQ
jgi:hypothetical protein